MMFINKRISLERAILAFILTTASIILFSITEILKSGKIIFRYFILILFTSQKSAITFFDIRLIW